MSKEYAMPILTVYDENGNEIAVPAITGKSAYQYAVSNGYTGTEEEFAKAMNPNNFSGSTEDYGDKFQLIDKELENLSDQLDDKVGTSELEKAIDDALAEIKDSGGFNTGEAVGVTPQVFSEEEKAQARTNIGAASTDDINQLSAQIPKKTSELENDGGYVTSTYVNAILGDIGAIIDRI